MGNCLPSVRLARKEKFPSKRLAIFGEHVMAGMDASGARALMSLSRAPLLFQQSTATTDRASSSTNQPPLFSTHNHLVFPTTVHDYSFHSFPVHLGRQPCQPLAQNPSKRVARPHTIAQEASTYVQQAQILSSSRPMTALHSERRLQSKERPLDNVPSRRPEHHSRHPRRSLKYPRTMMNLQLNAERPAL